MSLFPRDGLYFPQLNIPESTQFNASLCPCVYFIASFALMESLFRLGNQNTVRLGLTTDDHRIIASLVNSLSLKRFLYPGKHMIKLKEKGMHIYSYFTELAYISMNVGKCPSLRSQEHQWNNSVWVKDLRNGGTIDPSPKKGDEMFLVIEANSSLLLLLFHSGPP